MEKMDDFVFSLCPPPVNKLEKIKLVYVKLLYVLNVCTGTTVLKIFHSMVRRLLLLHAVCAASVAHAVVRPVGIPRLSRLAHALHHLLEPLPPTTSLLSASSLDELTNAAAPRAEGEIKLFAARPAAGIVPDGQPLPVLCLLHEFWGLSPSICEKAQGLADELGCFVVAPDTFRGVTTGFVPYAIWLALSTPQRRVNADLDDVLRWCAAQPGVDGTRVAVMGFCYGGGKAIRYTTEARPSAATVIFYGSPVNSVPQLEKLRAPVCAVYGVDDRQFPQRTVDAFKANLEAAEIEHEVVSYYGVGHAFWKDMSQIRDEQMPQLAAWRLSTAFLRSFYAGGESFAKKRAFLEYMLAQQGEEQDAPQGDGREYEEDEI